MEHPTDPFPPAQASPSLPDVAHPDLRCYLVVRTDLEGLNGGKMASQAGHAFANTLLVALATHPVRARAYLGAGPAARLREGQTRITLGGTLAQIARLADELEAAGIPHCLVDDAGKTVFEGPTTTCLAFGPIAPEERPTIAKRLRLLPVHPERTAAS